jgi:hypothetical protein
MSHKSEIAEERGLSPEETSLLVWMLEHAGPQAANYLSQVKNARVWSRCCCGCASINLEIGAVRPSIGDGMQIVADFEYRTDEGHLCGAFVFENGGLLAGLEV